MERPICLLAALATIAVMALPAVAGAAPGRLMRASEVPPGDGTLSPAAATAIKQGYLVEDQAAYERAKGGAPPSAADAPPSGPLAPVTSRGWDGIFDPSIAPSDATSAVGTTRFIEMVNRKFAIYDKTTNAPLHQSTLSALAGFTGTPSNPQILWDGQTSRFYYAMDVVLSATQHFLAIGYSKTASPSSEADFCHYGVGYGSEFPDSPKLGDMSSHWLIGSNVFSSGGSFLRSDVFWVAKPQAGTTCPSPGTFPAGNIADVRDSAGARAWGPVPSNQIDPSATGYVVARSGALPSQRLSLHRVTLDEIGRPRVQSPGSAVAVAGYGLPPDARQRSGFPNAAKLLDTLDARPTNAVTAIDPSRGAPNTAIWTQHTVAGGGGSQVRWYEIKANLGTLYQSGAATGGGYTFNGAISPDRVMRGVTRMYGQSMVLGFNSSDTGTFPSIRQLSKVATSPVSASVLVKASPANYVGLDCAGADNQCLWSETAGASPDPLPPSGPRGRVWLTSQYASGGTSTAVANWRTWNWVTTP